MRERSVETYLREQVRRAGGIAYKWVSPGNNGVPDRIVIMPGGRVVFVELKATGRKPTQLQQYQHERLRALGCDVRVIDSREGVDELMREMIVGATAANTNPNT